MKNNAKNWSVTPMALSRQKSIPQNSGVYGILRVERIEKLPVKLEVLYVGKSGNLRRRFGEHLDPTKEHNIDVNNAIRWDAPIEFWFLPVIRRDMSRMEKKLIQLVKPTLNIIQYGGENV